MSQNAWPYSCKTDSKLFPFDVGFLTTAAPLLLCPKQSNIETTSLALEGAERRKDLTASSIHILTQPSTHTKRG